MTKSISAEEFDRKFDAGEDVSEYIDWSSARRANGQPIHVTVEPKRVNVDFPAWMVNAMDREADRIGITRQAFIKVVMADHLEALGRA